MTRARDLASNAQGSKPTIVDAKGDIVVATAADTVDRLAVGDNGSIIVADSSTSTGLRYTGLFGANKNKILNGDFAINQRAFTTTTTNAAFGFDRWKLGLSGATATFSAETFTLGAAPVAGYEAKNFARLTVTTGNDTCRIEQAIESVRTFANQTVTVSFWAKGTNPTTAGNLKAYIQQYFGSGGSPSSTVTVTEQTFVLTANWTRYSLTFSVPSISGKTIGTDGNDALYVAFGQGTSISTDAYTLDIWGVQIEAGSVATPFQTATGTLAGELAACQRYYYRQSGGDTYGCFATGAARSTTVIYAFMPLPVTMRVAPTSMDLSTISVEDYSGTTQNSGTFTLESGGQQKNMAWIRYTHGSAVFTQYRPAFLSVVGSSSAYIGFSAELQKWQT